MISLTAEELKGVPKDVVSGYTKRTTEDGKEVYDATYKTPDIFPIVRRRWMLFFFHHNLYVLSFSSNSLRIQRLVRRLRKAMNRVFLSMSPFLSGL